MGNVVRLFHAEEIRFDQDRLGLLAAELGRAEADRIVTRAMEEIAIRLTRIENAFQAGTPDRVVKGTRGLVAIADQVGLTGLRDIAAATGQLAALRDCTALAASVARLVRVGEMSLVTVSDVEGMSG